MLTQRSKRKGRHSDDASNTTNEHPSLVFSHGLFFLLTPSFSPAQVAVVVRIGPPPLPVYDQPICPGEGYLWTPGYWAWDPDTEEHYWVPGTWVLAPEPRLLWTPGYWGWVDDGYRWYPGYWAPRVGFYGGIDYGYGYPGEGFYGGGWQGNTYRYNTAVTNVNTTIIHNTYNTQVTNNDTTVNRVSYNGGNGGTTARPTAADTAVARETHRQATPMQAQQQQTARSNREFHISTNRGNPPVAATPKPGVFSGPGVVPARSSANTPSPNTNRPNTQPHPEAEPNAPERPNPNAAKPPENKQPAEKPQPPRQPNNPPARENPPKNPHEKPAPPPPSNPPTNEKTPEPRPKRESQEKPPERQVPQPRPNKPEPQPKPEPPPNLLLGR